MTLRVGLIQLSSGDDPARNLPVTQDLIARAVDDGAKLIVTPEVTNCVSTDRDHQRTVLRSEADDPTLAALRTQARDAGVRIVIGSLALLGDGPDGRFVNRSFLIGPDGSIRARYDKIHMFDVVVTARETYRESAGYRPGQRTAVADIPGARLGLSICYDLRFPALYRTLAQAGADVLTVPSAFSPVTGAAHWHVLLRARAIECGAFVLAPAQTGDHAISRGRPRATYGHSLAVGPWGDVICDGGTEPGAFVVDLPVVDAARARRAVPAVLSDRRWA
ncbi:MAG: carbon-nitrogen hydrolase family protein [Pseudomonadota bacterium]